MKKWRQQLLFLIEPVTWTLGHALQLNIMEVADLSEQRFFPVNMTCRRVRGESYSSQDARLGQKLDFGLESLWGTLSWGPALVGL